MVVLAQACHVLLEQLDSQIWEGDNRGIDTSMLSIARNYIIAHKKKLEDSLEYKMARLDYYGEPLDEESSTELLELIRELGYEDVKATLGDSVDDVLTEVYDNG